MTLSQAVSALALSAVLLVLMVPHAAACVRRLHDVGRSGWWYFLSLVPVINLILLSWLLTDSEDGPNAWGPSPKQVEAPDGTTHVNLRPSRSFVWLEEQSTD